ncbi:MAG: type II toxin-antitoxin system VapC family toxin [Pyrinomonadaceae bacterium]
MTVEYILDASAVIAVLKAEAGHRIVAPLLPVSALGTINLAEVVSTMLDAGVPNDALKAGLAALNIGQIIEADENLAWEIGRLRLTTKNLGLSLGDRSCLALAKIKNLPAVTADKMWKNLSGFQVKLIR